MKKPTNYKRKYQRLMGELIRDYPNIPIGQHLEIAFEGYELCLTSEKELCYALEKYQKELALDIQNVAPEDYVYRILEDGEHLFDEKEDYEEEN